MAVIANRRSVMTLFSDATCPQSHRVRMVLAEKGITVEIVNIDPGNLPEDLIDVATDAGPEGFGVFGISLLVEILAIEQVLRGPLAPALEDLAIPLRRTLVLHLGGHLLAGPQVGGVGQHVPSGGEQGGESE